MALVCPVMCMRVRCEDFHCTIFTHVKSAYDYCNFYRSDVMGFKLKSLKWLPRWSIWTPSGQFLTYWGSMSAGKKIGVHET
ncbi:hypothetical protein GDO78_020519 [Eleutherodactylus coqui]|uniref:Uncharacterized protein n=1 Tax=Eleutherodactylus coqui TaxID=57060 RepID=A0A8J6BDU3_ELECQ|nr:hypothetical protein GDO78_020519 [Eleutherodactylus coqui]